MAQLMVNGKNYGPHPFVVPVRDMKTHEPLEGRYVGDIGPKVGYNTMGEFGVARRGVMSVVAQVFDSFSDQTMASCSSTRSKSRMSTCLHATPVSTQKPTNT